MLAHNIGVPYSELQPLLDERNLLVDMDRDEVWWLISEHADRRLGELMAIRREITKALETDRSRRIVRVAAQVGHKRRGPTRAR